MQGLWATAASWGLVAADAADGPPPPSSSASTTASGSPQTAPQPRKGGGGGGAMAPPSSAGAVRPRRRGGGGGADGAAAAEGSSAATLDAPGAFGSKLRVLLNVHDKQGVVDLCKTLAGRGDVELLSTGGTLRVISSANVPVADYGGATGFSEIIDGKWATRFMESQLQAQVIARPGRLRETAELRERGLEPIDLVVMNLFPFGSTVQPHTAVEDAIENIDLGIPLLLRAAARNFPHVVVLTDPKDYAWVASRLCETNSVGKSGLSEQERRALAHKAFRHVALYDMSIAHYLGQTGEKETLPAEMALAFKKLCPVKNLQSVHTRAAVYSPLLEQGGLVSAKKLGGADLNVSLLLDSDAAWRAVLDFEEPTVCVMKDGHASGIACSESAVDAFQRATLVYPASRSVVAFNRPVSLDAAEAIVSATDMQYAAVVAAAFDRAALEKLKTVKELLLLEVPVSQNEPQEQLLDLRILTGGGMLVQTGDERGEQSSWHVVSDERPTADEMRDLVFAWRCLRHVKPNAVVLAKDRAMIAPAYTWPDRGKSVELALRVAGEDSTGAVLASEAAFSNPEPLEIAADGGVVAIVTPGGSHRDQSGIDSANEWGLTLLFTGMRPFRRSSGK